MQLKPGYWREFAWQPIFGRGTNCFRIECKSDCELRSIHAEFYFQWRKWNGLSSSLENLDFQWKELIVEILKPLLLNLLKNLQSVLNNKQDLASLDQIKLQSDLIHFNKDKFNTDSPNLNEILTGAELLAQRYKEICIQLVDRWLIPFIDTAWKFF